MSNNNKTAAAKSEADEIIEQYRSILFSMTRKLVKGWQERFNSETSYQHNKVVALFLKQSDEFAWDYFESVAAAMPPEVRNKPRQVRRDMRRVINNLQRNWGELMTVCNQRDNASLRKLLKAADEEAEGLYKQYEGFKATVDGKPVVPITYFGSRYDITRYPFTPVPLLSFRFEALGEPKLRRNGLAHELGHFIYWNADPAVDPEKLIEAHRGFDDEIEKELRASKNLSRHSGDLSLDWQNWKTEVFADIVGALLIGPSYIETSMLLYVDEQPVDEGAIYAEDTTHPLPILRPLISLVTLEELAKMRPDLVPGNQRSQLARLRKQWQDRYDQAKNPVIENDKETPESVERRGKAAEAVEQTSRVVHSLMTQPLWLDKHGEKCALYSLFKNNPQQEDIDNRQVAEPIHVKSQNFAEMKSALVEAAKKKNGLLQSNKVTLSADDEKMITYRALVELQLAETEGIIPCVPVVQAAANQGIYIPLSTCKEGGSNVVRVRKGQGTHVSAF